MHKHPIKNQQALTIDKKVNKKIDICISCGSSMKILTYKAMHAKDAQETDGCYHASFAQASILLQSSLQFLFPAIQNSFVR